MKKTLLTILALLLCVSLLAACGGKENGDKPVNTADIGSTADTSGDDKSPVLEGRYQMTVYEINGEDMIGFFASMYGQNFDAETLYIEIKSGGKCVLSAGDEPYECTYTLDGNAIEIDMGDGEVMKGTVTADTVTIEDESEGNTMLLVFEKGGTLSVSPPPDGNNTATAVQEKWNGVWYGYMWLTEFYGAYENSENDFFDAFMEINVDEDGVGTMEIYTAFESEYYSFSFLRDYLYLEADIIADEYSFEVTEGIIYDDFGDMDLDPDDWLVWLGQQGHDEYMVFMTDIFLDDDLDGFEFIFTFRPNGSLWEDQLKGWGSAAKIPPGYYEYIDYLDVESAAEIDQTFPPAPIGGAGVTTTAQIVEYYDWLNSLPVGGKDELTYEDFVEGLGDKGEPLEIYDGADPGLVVYKWSTPNGDYLQVYFVPKDDGIYYYNQMLKAFQR